MAKTKEEPQRVPEVADVPESLPIERPPFEAIMEHLDYYLREQPETRESLRSHEVVAGIAGEIGDRLAQNKIAIKVQEEAMKAASAKEQELLQLAENDPEAFAEKFRTEQGAAIAQRELQQIAYKERKALADSMGRALQDLPEWKELTRDDMAQLAQAVSGAPEDEVIGAYQRAAIDLVAAKRADREALSKKDEWLRAEKEAWEAERAAKQVKAAPAPNLRVGQGTPSNEPPDFQRDPDGYNRWYEENVLRHRRTAS